jgi:glycosyltransferase involved in cell wall biosynthesis
MFNFPSVSVAIATYEMSGRGRYFLRQALESILVQDYPDVEVVISDDSKDDEIASECRDWDAKLRIRYFQNTGPRISASRKLNLAIDKCEGSVVKILCQDDLLADPSSLKKTVEGLTHGNVWLVSAYAHVDENNVRLGSHTPKPNLRIERKNTIGSHSGLAFLKNQQHQRFDEKLFWRMDCELYRRLFENYGKPFYLLSETVKVRQWQGQATNSSINNWRRFRELVTVSIKYPLALQN